MIALLALALQDLQAVEDLGLRVARGFKVSMISTPDLANDLYCMTLDGKGRPVVSSAGWVKTLHDDDGDGKMDRATTFAETKTGAMGLHFEGNDLYASCDQHVMLFRDKDGDGKADGPGEPLFKLLFGEHGAHAIRKGPDGKLYVMGGNDAGITGVHVSSPSSPVRNPEAGALIRFSPDGKEREVLAHGFRNAYDFDFNERGDLFTYDSDCERDYLLPWYTPTRVYHVQIGMHHGWRLNGWTRSFARRDYGIDTVEMLVPVGRGSPTGVAVYRGKAFPARYQGGLFYADWTFGKVYFTPLIPEGSTYKPGLIETFLEPSGSDGFAPTDLVTTADGALLVSIGGRRTRGAIFRIVAESSGGPPFLPRMSPPAVDRRAVREAALRGEGALGRIWAGEPGVDAALAELKTPLDGVRLLQLALGDAAIHKPAVEVHAMYALPRPPAAEVRARILGAVRPLFPGPDEILNLESSRLLAMLEDDSILTLARTAARITERSDATSDIHYLIVLSRLTAPWPEGMADKAADALLSLSRKLAGQELRSKQAWGDRLAELAKLFAARDPHFVDALLAHPAFVAPAHVDLAAALGGPAAARRFLKAALEPAFVWSERLLALLASLPAEELHPALRGQWSNYGLRDAIILHLAKRPDPQDREKFLAALESPNAQVQKAAVDALEALPRDGSPRKAVPLLRLLRRLALEPKQAELRARVSRLVGPQAVKEVETTPAALRQAYQPVFDAVLKADPSVKAELEDGDPAALKKLLEGVDWDRGDAARGVELFRARGCQTCHAAQGALGPNLAGASTRFSRDDFLEAIANPSKDVAPPYRTTAFQTRDGQVHLGMIAFSSADGVIVQTGATTTVRLATGDIAATKPSLRSLMPDGLLTGLKPSEIADLYAYLKSLK